MENDQTDMIPVSLGTNRKLTTDQAAIAQDTEKFSLRFRDSHRQRDTAPIVSHDVVSLALQLKF